MVGGSTACVVLCYSFLNELQYNMGPNVQKFNFMVGSNPRKAKWTSYEFCTFSSSPAKYEWNQLPAPNVWILSHGFARKFNQITDNHAMLIQWSNEFLIKKNNLKNLFVCTWIHTRFVFSFDYHWNQLQSRVHTISAKG